MFWFKKNKVVLDCFTTDPFVYEYAKIDTASKFYPGWWKQLPNVVSDINGNNIPSMKYCRGLTEMYKNSLAMPYWGGAVIEMSDSSTKMSSWKTNYKVPVEPSDRIFQQHPPQQYAGFVSDNFVHYKIIAPWVIKCKEKVNFFMSDPVWNKSKINDYTVLPGVIDFKYQPVVNINIMLEFTKEIRLVQLSVNDVICFLTPLTEREVIVRHHLVDEKEYANTLLFARRIAPIINHLGIGDQTSYVLNKKFIDKHEERNKTKCPFGFKI